MFNYVKVEGNLGAAVAWAIDQLEADMMAAQDLNDDLAMESTGEELEKVVFIEDSMRQDTDGQYEVMEEDAEFATKLISSHESSMY